MTTAGRVESQTGSECVSVCVGGVSTCTGNNMIIIIIPERISLLSDTETCSWRLDQFKRKTHQSGRRTIDVTAASHQWKLWKFKSLEY